MERETQKKTETSKQESLRSCYDIYYIYVLLDADSYSFYNRCKAAVTRYNIRHTDNHRLAQFMCQYVPVWLDKPSIPRNL